MKEKFIVAIGYSEGGLEPLLTFFDHVPHDDITYVILRHIPADQRSTLAQILQRHSKLKIKEARNGIVIEKDIIYIPPPDSYLLIKEDRLYLKPRVTELGNHNCSIDIFLQSLAEAKGRKSVAVILSGNGCDGTVGIIHIQKAGGIAIAQHPGYCDNPQMPQCAIDTGCVENILLPAEMPDFIAKHVHPILNNANAAKRFKH